jgi:O-antigen ligase
MCASSFRKLFWAGALLFGMYYVLRTGSRGALVALAVAFLYAFVKSPLSGKAAAMAVVLTGVMLAPVVIPQRIIDRYATILSDSDAPPENEAEGSTASRIYLMKKGIELTVRYPAFGVGAGMFRLAAHGTMKGNVTHNTYLQVSSETGIPGLLIYLTVIGLAFHRVGRVMKKAKAQPALSDVFRIAYALRASWIILIMSMCFASVAYDFPIIVLLSITEVLKKTADVEIAARLRTAAAPVPAAAAARALLPRQLART